MDTKGADGARQVRWVQAGEGVKQLAEIPSIVTRRLGLIQVALPIVGTSHLDHASDVQVWARTTAAGNGLVPADALPKPVRIGRDLVISNHDLAKPDDFAVLVPLGLRDQRPYLVKIVEIILPAQVLTSEGCALGVLVQLCQVGENVHPYGMPRVLVLEHRYLLVPPQVSKTINLHHDTFTSAHRVSNAWSTFSIIALQTSVT